MSKKKSERVEYVPLSRLIVDETYQRILREKRIQEYAKVFNHSLIGVLEVSERKDGTLFVMDGQHRAALLRLVGETKALCHIHNGLSIEDEAQFFRFYNRKRNQISGWDDWKAARRHNDPLVIAADAVVEGFGLKMAPYSGPSTVASFKFVTTLMSVKGGGAGLLTRTLSITQPAWGGQQRVNEGELLMAIGTLLRCYGDKISDTRAIAKWSKDYTPSRLVGAAKDKSYNERVSTVKAIALILEASYDKGLNNSKKLRPREENDLLAA